MQKCSSKVCYVASTMLFISHISALEYWRSAAGSRSRYAYASSAVWNRQCNLGARSSCAPTAAAVERLLRQFPCFKSPVHCMVVHPACRRDLKCAVCAVHAHALPSQSFVRVADGVYVASPALCLSQMAGCLSRFDAVKLGYEFAGSYRLSQDDSRGFFDRVNPILCLEDLAVFLEGQKSLHGAKSARSNLSLLLPGSASPKETQLAILFYAARRTGAYGLPQLRLNYPIPLDATAQMMTGSKLCRVDICWPEANLAVEYDSDFAHTGSGRIAADSARRSALLHMGMQVVEVTRMQLNDFSALDQVVVVLEAQLGMRSRPANEVWRRAQMKLRRQVVRIDRYGMRP